jgi:antitoxin component YwqK of YwqJK toxin-antitoxin module
MEVHQKPTKLKKWLKSKFSLLTFSLIWILLYSCAHSTIITYYEYLNESPIITTDKKVAMQKHIIGIKTINDTLHYYFTNSAVNQTRDYEKAKNGYIIATKNLKNGMPIGLQICLDGFGDTLFADYLDIHSLDSLHISYYGNRKMKFYQEFKAGREHGISKSFYLNGIVQQERNWVEGYLHGNEVNRFKTGRIESMGENIKGIKKGTWLFFNENGDTIQTKIM